FLLQLRFRIFNQKKFLFIGNISLCSHIYSFSKTQIKQTNLIQFTKHYHLSFLYNLFYAPYLLKRRV
ncbi:TPA: hypothetical protein I4G43_21315, partial [Enterobacter hormaechei subsp. hoffmannii]|nr:hypothetical protein [Enterobacter hormaechei subsp. hoffmannii]